MPGSAGVMCMIGGAVDELPVLIWDREKVLEQPQAGVPMAHVWG